MHSRTSATKIINHIAINVKKKICQHIKQINGKVFVLIDESTSLSIKTALIVYLKCESDKEGDKKNPSEDAIPHNPFFAVAMPRTKRQIDNISEQGQNINMETTLSTDEN